MSIVNQNKPTPSLTNSTRVSGGETWGTIASTWATETRTWQAVSQLFTNTSKDTGGGVWASTDYPWLVDLPWLTMDKMVNQSKP